MIRLRFAQPEDAEALLEIYRPYVETTTISFETETPTAAEFAQRIISYSARYPYLAAVEDDVILGYAYAHAFHERAAYDFTAETSIYVSQTARGRHVGKALYTALLKLLTLQGVKNACAVITFPNIPSTAFHQAMGFEAGGVLPDFGYKLGDWHSVAYLWKPLGDKNTPPSPLIPCPALEPAQVAAVLKDAIS